MMTATAAAVPSCSTCFRASDNAASSCPARMSDGRLFTDYRPRRDQITGIIPIVPSPVTGESCTAAATCAAPSSAMGSYEFRMHLVNNAEEVMRRNMMGAYEATACGPCDHTQAGTMLPETAAQRCDVSTCTFQPTNSTAGLGLGRTYDDPASSGRSAVHDVMLRKQFADQQRIASQPNACTIASDKLAWSPIW